MRSSTALLTTAGDASPILLTVDREEQLRHLPIALAVALRMSEAGADDAFIAAALGIEPECVSPLIAVARAKVERIARDSGDQTP